MRFRYASILFCSLLLGCDWPADSLDVQYYEGEDPLGLGQMLYVDVTALEGISITEMELNEGNCKVIFSKRGIADFDFEMNDPLRLEMGQVVTFGTNCEALVEIIIQTDIGDAYFFSE